MKFKTFLVLIVIITVTIVIPLLLANSNSAQEVKGMLDWFANAAKTVFAVVGWPWIVTGVVKSIAIQLTNDSVPGYAHLVMIICLFALVATVQLCQTQDVRWTEQQAVVGLGLTSFGLTYIFTTGKPII